MKADILREKFLVFFKSKKHRIIEADSLVPKDDPTVLFTPAGMNQFKKEFMGYNAGFTCAATCQRCLRTDDLEKVGKTPGHHTFFEMLGNFSFGDYFKEKAIAWAWEFLTDELKIPVEKLWVSVYEDDGEANKIWQEKIRVSQDKIIKLGDKENFWPSEAKAKGPNGPCGPCSEIFFDWGRDIGCGRDDCNPSCDCGRFVEVWNLVFTQFNRKEGGILEPLPKKNIDTGMGLERLAAVMQGVKSNFETDLFIPIVKEIELRVKGQGVSEKELVYAVADHIRAIAFAIYDGVLPSNDGRGYVVRKIIRKSILHLRQLGIRNPFLYKLVPVLSEAMKSYYPEMQTRQENIAEIILAEEKSFIATLDSSDSLFKEKFAQIMQDSNPVLSGRIAFQLYDTYGIPLELTKGWLDKHSINFSQESFNQELEAQKSRSKLQSAMKGEVFDLKGIVLGLRETKFLGYKDYQSRAKILKIIKDNQEAKKINKNDTAEIILDKTAFYPEAGGQVGDTGELVKGKNIFEVLDTKKIGKVIIHIGKVKQGSFKKSDSVLAKLNLKRRLAIARNHTATHLLQAALRKVLGEHVRQQGSLVAEDRLRFDFTHFKDIDKRQLNRIEELVNNYIIDNFSLSAKQMPLSQAKRKGALAFFAEKYEMRVRVVSVGDFSKELCGGTHLDSTGQIGIFKIIREGSVASGIRRIEAVTGKEAYKIIKEEERIINDISDSLDVPVENITQEIEKRISRIKELEKQLIQYKSESLKKSIDEYISHAENIKGIKFITPVSGDMDSVRKAVDLIKDKVKENAIIFSSTGNTLKTQILWATGVTLDLCAKGIDATKFISPISQEVGGSGNARKDFAQGGGNQPQNYNKALQKIKEIIESSL
jgi:alanyl-tRNA synthetase